MNVLDWLKRLFARMAPVETAKEEKPLYEIHCHQCDNVFMSSGILLDGGCNFSLLMLTRVCPKCGSHRIMPMMFEDDEFHVKSYHSYWERLEREAKMKEEKRLKSQSN